MTCVTFDHERLVWILPAGNCNPAERVSWTKEILQWEFHGPGANHCPTVQHNFLYIDAGEKSCKKKAGICIIRPDQLDGFPARPGSSLPGTCEKTQDTLTAPPQLVVTKASSHLPFTCCLPAWALEEATRIMPERASRVLANEEELNVMERGKADFKEKTVQPIDGVAGKEQRARRTNCLRLPECRRSTRDASDMHQSFTRGLPECGRCTTCKMHLTMAAIVSLQNQLFRGSRSHGI